MNLARWRLDLEKWSVLAALRFVLASIVAVNHLGEYAELGLARFIPRLGAFEAILGFLLISGYSIGVSYLKEPGRFLWRRLKRLYPIYLAAIVITVAVNVWILGMERPTVGFVAVNAVFLNQALTDTSLVGPAWSLSLEFWLYCLAPFLIALRPGQLRALVYSSFASYLAYTACRTLFHLPYYSGVAFGGNLLLLSFMWIAGLRLASPRNDTGEVMLDIRWICFFHIACEAGIQFASRLKHHEGAAFFTADLLNFGLKSLTLWVVYGAFLRFVVQASASARPSRWLRFLGDVSYPLYLIHIPVFAVLAKTGLRQPALLFALALAISAALYWMLDFYSKRRHLGVSAVL